ncbi:hypothetical protein D3C71_2160870 [compost metagenome]
MEVEFPRPEAAVVILPNEQIRTHGLGKAGTARHTRRSNFITIQIQLDFAMISIEYSV